MVDPLSELFGLDPDAPHLLEALTHPSYANENPGVVDNQRLEFLGDAVLGLYVGEYLWSAQPTASEGELTQTRARLVSADALARFAREHELTRYMRFGRGADTDRLRDRTNVLADLVEALIAASYLDAGPAAASAICCEIAAAGLEKGGAADPKSALQERVQAAGRPAPRYEVVSVSGPAHLRSFEVAVCVGDERLAMGSGRSKRDAERAAAAAALARPG